MTATAAKMTAPAAIITCTELVPPMSDYSRIIMRCDFCSWQQELAADDETADMYHPVRLCRDGSCPHCGMPLRLFESSAAPLQQ